MAEATGLTRDDVKSMIKDIFAEFAPVFKDLAVTPEKLREANRPYVAPEVIARQQREQADWRAQEEQNQKTREQLQKNCTHKDEQGRWAIRLQHNFHDLAPRGVCPHCLINIWPAHFDHRPIKGKDTAVLVKEHPLYHIVRELEAFQ